MNSHLTSRQMSKAVLGSPDAEADRHLRVCPECREAVRAFDSDLALFGNSVRAWGEDRSAFRRAPVLEARSRFSVPSWSVAAAALAVLVVAFLVGESRTGDRKFQTALVREPAIERVERSHSRTAPVTDAALMERVSMELGRSVPGPMEPLARLTVTGGVAGRNASLVR